MTYFRVSAQGVLPQGDIFVTSYNLVSSQVLSAVHASTSGAVQTFWGVLKTYLPPQTILKNVITTELNPATGKNEGALTTAVNVIGTGTAPVAPQNTCILVSLRTAKANKGGRGRQYLPSPVTANLTNTGGLSTTVGDAIDTAYGAMITTVSAVGQVVILHGGFSHRDSSGAPVYLALSHDVVTSSQVVYILATQRRRTNKVLRTASV